jgi:hypothetical protein
VDILDQLTKRAQESQHDASSLTVICQDEWLDLADEASDLYSQQARAMAAAPRAASIA